MGICRDISLMILQIYRPDGTLNELHRLKLFYLFSAGLGVLARPIWSVNSALRPRRPILSDFRHNCRAIALIVDIRKLFRR